MDLPLSCFQQLSLLLTDVLLETLGKSEKESTHLGVGVGLLRRFQQLSLLLSAVLLEKSEKESTDLKVGLLIRCFQQLPTSLRCATGGFGR